MLKKIIILFTLAYSFISYAGHETGNGGNFKDFFSDNAWFVDNKPVHYCVKRSDTFVVGDENVLNTITRSLNKWRALAQTLETHLGEHSIQTDFIYNEVCQHDIDLVFYLGGQPREISNILKQHKRMVALAYPLEVNKTKTWSRGFIYIKDSNFIKNEDGIVSNNVDPDDLDQIYVADWSYKNNLDAILLHEIGHVFGVAHIPQTVMRKSIALDLVMEDELELPTSYKQQINHEHTLIPNKLTPHLSVYSGGSEFKLDLSDEKRYIIVEGQSDRKNVYEFIPDSKNEIINFVAAYMSDSNYVFKRQTVSSDNNSTSFVVGAFVENFVMSGHFRFGNESFPGMYLKNVGNFSHQFKIYRNGNWEILVSFKN